MDQVQPSAIKNRLEPPDTSPFEETHSSLGLYLARAAKSDSVSLSPHLPKATPRPHSMQQFLSGIAASSDRAKPHQTQSIGENFTVALNHSYLNEELVLQSLEAKRPSFKKSIAADGTQNLTEMSGVKLNFHTFGHDQKLDVRSIAISKEANGSTRFQLQVDNPLPFEVEKVFNAPSTLPLNFVVDAKGRVSYPRDSEVLHSLSEHSNTTLPGLVLRDALSDAGDVAQFIEHNPAWVKNIMAPFMSRFGTYLKSDFDPSVVLNSAQPDKAAPTGKATQAGKADQAQPAVKNSTTDSVKPRATDVLPATDASTFKIKGPGDYVETMQIEGRTRSFHVHVPASYDAAKPMPMMLLAAGMSQTGKDVEEMFQANKLADKEGFIAVYPDSVNWFDVKDLRTWESGNGLVLPGQKASDVKFMGDIIEATKKQVNIDPQRIYMAGLSNGGMLTYSTAAALSGTLAGIGILSSTMSGKEPAPKEPLSMINIHGTADRIIPYEGMTDTPPVLTDVGVPVFQPAHFGTDYYRKLAGITTEPTVVKNGIETIERSSNPANGTAVEHITLAGVDHFLDDPAHRLQQVWDFFEAHPRPTPPKQSDNVEVKTSMAVEELTTVKQLQAAMKQRGVAGMEQDVDNIFDAALTISDGSISPSRIFDKITRSTHVAFNDPVNKFIQNTTLISKKQNTITIDRKVNADIPLHVSFGVGALKSIEIGKTSFDLAKSNGYPQLKNISGITLHAQVAGYNLDSDIQAITELPAGHNGANGRIYRATMENPLPGWMRTVLFSPGKFNVDLQFDPSGNPAVVNRSQTERQLLGKNPFVSGIADEAQDVANLYHHPGWLNGLTVASDVGITGGLTYAAYRFGGSRAKLAATVGFIAAPMVINLIRRNIS